MSARRARDEQGSALVLSLVFLTVMGLVTAGLMSFLQTGFRATTAVRAQRSESYSADGGAKAAIEQIRKDLEAGRENKPCEPVTTVIDGQTVTVECEGQPGSGRVTEATTEENRPAHALLSLSTNSHWLFGEDGILQQSNGTVAVEGSVFSNTTIETEGRKASLAVEGPVSALGDCDHGHITTTEPPLRCRNRADKADPALGADPGYAPPVSVRPPEVTVPTTCSSNQWLATLEPGTYTDADDLDSLTDGKGNCNKLQVVWMKPGIYYFDFGWDEVWDIDERNVTVIGGDPKGWDPAGGRNQAIPRGAACKTVGDGPRGGVTILLGGVSRMHVHDGGLELCAPPNEHSQQVAIQGLAHDTPPQDTALPIVRPATATGDFTAAGILAIGDNRTSTASMGWLDSRDATLRGYPLPALPAGAELQSVGLRIRHRETTGGPSVQVRGDRRTIVSGNISQRSSLHQDTIDLSGYVDSIADLADLEVSLEWATGFWQGSGTAELDGVELDITYRQRGLDALDGWCTNNGLGYPYAWAGVLTCAGFYAEGGPTFVAIHGTIYVPTAPVNIQVRDAATAVVDRGIIARVIVLGATPSDGYSGPLVTLPEFGGGRADRQVLFTAWSCDADLPCAGGAGGAQALRVLVTYRDREGALPGDAVEIEHWSVLR